MVQTLYDGIWQDYNNNYLPIIDPEIDNSCLVPSVDSIIELLCEVY